MTSEKRILRQILEHAPVGIVKLDPGLLVVDINKAMAWQTGYEPEDLIGSNLFEKVPYMPEQIASAISQGRTLRIDAHPVRDLSAAPGKMRYWDLAEWPLKDEEERLAGAILLVTDATDRVRLMQQRADLTATLAHDLKTPLLGADRALGLLLDGVLGELKPAQTDVISMVRKSNQEFLSRIKTLLEVLRYEAADQVLNLRSLDLAKLVKACLKDMSMLSESQKVSVAAQVEEGTCILADREAIKRLLINLLDNAIKFTLPGGSVRVGCESGDTEVVLKIADTGMGIPADEIPKLFQRFWQGEPGRSYPVGSGLGLYLCQRIVEAHGGQITCQSAPGVGTTFWIKLPAAPD